MMSGLYERDQAYQDGAKYARNTVLATIIGLQNREFGNPDSGAYRAYQELYELIIARHGDMFEQFKG